MPNRPARSSEGSELRQLLLWAAAGLCFALVCVGLALLYLGQVLHVAPSSKTIARAIRSQTRSVRKLSVPVVAEQRAADLWCGAVTFVVQTPEGEPVAGSAVLDRMFHEESVQEIELDEDGQFTMEKVRCSPAYRVRVSRVGPAGVWYDVRTAPGQDTYTIVVGALGEREVRSLRRKETCPLRVIFEHVDGTPVDAPVRMAHVGGRDEWLDLDADGSIDFPEARCEQRPRIWMKRDAPKRARMFSLTRIPDDEPELVVTMGRTAEVRVVDRDGERIDGVTLKSDATVELQASGDFRLTGHGDETWVQVVQPDRRNPEHTIPLNGELHEVEMARDRSVEVTLLCDQCAGEVWCGPNRCEGSQPVLICLCPGENALLQMQTPDALWGASSVWDPLASIPDGEEHITVEVPGERGSVRFTVVNEPTVHRSTFGLFRTRADGSMPPLPRSFYWEPYQEYGLERDGDVRWAEEVLPGAWTIGWMEQTWTADGGWTKAYASRDFVLQSGQELDLGVIGR